jgi:uncharacterized protein (DUF58 family)
MKPTARMVAILAGGFAVSFAPVFLSARLWTLWIAWVGLVFLLAGVDLVLSLPARRLRVTARAPETAYIGDEPESLLVELRAPARRAGLRVQILADVNEELAPPPEVAATLDAEGRAAAPVPLRPRRRGTARVARVHLHWDGPLGLVRRQTTRAVDAAVAVVPNVRAVRAAALRFFGTRELLVGLKVERFVGDGSEFESLREYVPGLDHRAIDWKASARHRKLLNQEFRAERNHQIILACDTGHLMREPLGGVPRLDHAVNAALLLAWFGLKSGDRVGLYAFDERPRQFTEPQGGVGSFARLQAATADLAYSTGETNFTLGLASLSARLRRRSMVVVLTDFVDSVTAELMIENLDRLARRHLCVFVTLRDPTLERVAAAPPRTLTAVHRAVVAGDLAREREVVLRRLRRLGVHAIDTPPESVSAQLLNRYLDIKRREMI